MVATVGETLGAFYGAIARHLRARGLGVSAFAALSPLVDLHQWFDEVWNAPWSRDARHLRGAVRAIWSLRLLVGVGAYDLVHVATPIAAAVTRLALRGSFCPIVYTAHGFHFHRQGTLVSNALFLGVERLCARWNAALMVVNNDDYMASMKYRLAPKRRVILIPGTGVDVGRFAASPAREAAIGLQRAQVGLPASTPVFLVVGEFIRRKRQLDVLQALSLLRARNCCVAFAGRGPEMEAARSEATRLSLGENVVFLGFRQDIPSLLHASSALVSASSQEGLPTCVIEAMAAGVPVIGSRIRGTEDLLSQGCGLLYPLGDVAALAAAMSWVLDHPGEARALGRRGRELARRYSLERVLRVHEGVYSAVSERIRNALRASKTPV